MIRDSTKLLCRIIEEFENAGKRSRGDTDFTPQRRGLSTPIVLAGLTDRNEWPDATLKAFYYGAELNKGFKRQDFIDEAGSGEKGEEKSVMVTISGEGSPVEEFIKSLQSEGRSLPNRIMLTGMHISKDDMDVYLEELHMRSVYFFLSQRKKAKSRLTE